MASRGRLDLQRGKRYLLSGPWRNVVGVAYGLAGNGGSVVGTGSLSSSTSGTDVASVFGAFCGGMRLRTDQPGSQALNRSILLADCDVCVLITTRSD